VIFGAYYFIALAVRQRAQRGGRYALAARSHGYWASQANVEPVSGRAPELMNSLFAGVLVSKGSMQLRLSGR
jgi:hypothetical protein